MLELFVAYHLLSIQPPPSEYDRPYPGMHVQYATPEQISRWCGNSRALACTIKYEDKCTIVLPHGTEEGSMIYRHERAHCHGWSYDHH